MKDLLTSNRKIEETTAVVLDDRFSVIFQKSLLSKMMDLGSFTIPCSIGALNKKIAFARLEGKHQYDPLQMLSKVGTKRAKTHSDDNLTSQQSIRHPRRIIEDV